MYVQRQTLRFPIANSNAVLTAVGVPGPAEFGSTMAQNSGATSVGKIVRPDPFGSTWQDAITRLPILDRNGLPLLAISIAPDSALACCDIWLNEDSDLGRYRCSPGNPVFADFSQHSFVNITLPYAVPITISPTLTAVWDGQILRSTTMSQDIFQLPLRLDLWYGGVPVRFGNRAPYHAHVEMVMATAASTLAWWFCVDGRRRVSYKFFPGSAPETFTLTAHESMKLNTQVVLDQSIPVLPALSGPTLIPNLGNVTQVDLTLNTGIMFIQCSITDSVGSATPCEVRAVAVDDANC